MHGIVIIEKYYGMLLVDVLSNPRQCGINISHLDKERCFFFLYEVSNQDTNDIFLSHIYIVYSDKLNVTKISIYSLMMINLYMNHVVPESWITQISKFCARRSTSAPSMTSPVPSIPWWLINITFKYVFPIISKPVLQKTIFPYKSTNKIGYKILAIFGWLDIF